AHFRARGRGHLIIVSSIVGQRGIAMMSGYSATKAAQVAFAESLRTEFNGTGIAISVVLSVSTETEFRSAMERDYGYSVSGLGPKQSVDDVAGGVVACLRKATPQWCPHASRRALATLTALAPRLTANLPTQSARRREARIGRGHRAFEVTGDPALSSTDAARRRDFTINAIAWDPLLDEYIDPFNGRRDIAARILQAVDVRTFPEDSLRVLRAVQFAAR